MGNLRPEFDTTDKAGKTLEFTGSVGTTAIKVPAVAGNLIDEISIRCRVDQPGNTRLEFSFNGIDFFRLSVGESREEEPREKDKSNNDIKQVWIRAAGSGVSSAFYEIVINEGIT